MTQEQVVSRMPKNDAPTLLARQAQLVELARVIGVNNIVIGGNAAINLSVDPTSTHLPALPEGDHRLPDEVASCDPLAISFAGAMKTC